MPCRELLAAREDNTHLDEGRPVGSPKWHLCQRKLMVKVTFCCQVLSTGLSVIRGCVSLLHPLLTAFPSTSHTFSPENRGEGALLSNVLLTQFLLRALKASLSLKLKPRGSESLTPTPTPLRQGHRIAWLLGVAGSLRRRRVKKRHLLILKKIDFAATFLGSCDPEHNINPKKNRKRPDKSGTGKTERKKKVKWRSQSFVG